MRFWRVVAIVVVILLGLVVSRAMYWTLPHKWVVLGYTMPVGGQPDPEIKEYIRPAANTGVNATGQTLNQWIDQKRLGAEWAPAPLPPIRPGDTYYVLRDMEFFNKVQTSDATVTEVYLGCSEQAGMWHRGPSYPVPTRTYGRVRRNFKVTLPADILPGCWRFQVGVLFYKNPMFQNYRAVFEDVVVHVLPKARP